MIKLRILVIFLVLTGFAAIKGILAVEASVDHSYVAQNEIAGLQLVAVGNGDTDTYSDLFRMITEESENDPINILLLPIAYQEIDNLSTSDVLLALENACNRAVTTERSCQVNLAPDLNTSRNSEGVVLQAISDDLAAVLLLSNDPKKASSILENSAVEQALEGAYQNNVVIAGLSEAGNLLSRAMMRGYMPGFSADQALRFGAVDVGSSGKNGGLAFGVQAGITDLNIFQAGNVGRLLNAISFPGTPHVGLGVDAFSGAGIQDHTRIGPVFGLYTTAIFDAETYQSANGVQYRGPNNLISMRNVIFHLLPPSDYSYDLSTRQHSLAPYPQQVQRESGLPEVPEGAGALILGGGLSGTSYEQTILERFVNLSGGREANILIVASGYTTNRAARLAAERYQAALNVSSTIVVVSKGTFVVPPVPENISGILMIGEDPSLIPVDLLPDIRSLWLEGVPVLADNAAASVAGVYHMALEPNPESFVEAEAYTQEVLLQGRSPLLPGLGLINVTVETSIQANNRWGRLFALAYNQPEYVALGLNRGTALILSPKVTTVEGGNVVLAVDLRSANLALGSNGGYVIANGLMDIFAPGEVLHFQDADSITALIHAATPVIPTATATITPTMAPTGTTTPTATPLPPTRTPRTRPPTRTPLPTPIIPPAMDANLTNAMIIVGVFAVIAVFIGFWLNRQRL
jgi:cyanophycinase-like exopeptidase